MSDNQIDFSLLENFTSGMKNLAFIVKRYGINSETHVSDSIKDICGYTSEEIKRFPENLYTLIHEEDSEKIKKDLIEFETNPERSNAEFVYRIKSKDGNLPNIYNTFMMPRRISLI